MAKAEDNKTEQVIKCQREWEEANITQAQQEAGQRARWSQGATEDLKYGHL